MAPIVLSPETHEEIFLIIKNAFQDFALFDKLVANQLRKLIADSNQVEIDVKTTRKLAERYFDESKFQTDQQKLIWQQIQIILRTTYVLILSYSQENRAQYFWPNIETLVENYPQFQGQPAEELEFLLKFRNYMTLALLIIPARLNKQLLLKIVSRLEGTGNEYITGGGQKPCVTRRVDIYEKEGSVVRKKIMNPPVKKPKTSDEGNIGSAGSGKMTGSKRKKDASSLTLKDVKLMRLPTDEIELLAQAPPDPFSSNATNNINNFNDSVEQESRPDGYHTSGNIFTGELNTTNTNMTTSAMDNLLFAATAVATVNDLNHILPTAPSSSSAATAGGGAGNVNGMLAMDDDVGRNITLSQGSSKPYAISDINGFAPVINRQQSELLDRLLSESVYHQLAGAIVDPTGMGAMGMDNLSQSSVGTYLDPHGLDANQNNNNNNIPLSASGIPAGYKYTSALSRTSSIAGGTVGSNAAQQTIPMLRSLSWDVYNGLLMHDLDDFLNSSSQTM